MTIAIFGSANIDIAVTVKNLPQMGQTIHAKQHQLGIGGKGANQAVAAKALYAADVRFIAAVGDDVFGDMFRHKITHYGLGTTHLYIEANSPTGIALIHSDDQAQNAITVCGGANMTWPQSGPPASHFDAVKVALFQLETPLDATISAMQNAKAAKAMTILDPAPVPDSNLDELLQLADIITPNQHEAEALSGGKITTLDDALGVAGLLCARGPQMVVITLGDLGVAFSDGAAIQGIIPAFPVAALDSVAAGDCFNGALAVGLAEAMTFQHAVLFAAAASALSVTKAGAAASAPSRADVDVFLQAAG